jgi:hypothetical protein
MNKRAIHLLCGLLAATGALSAASADTPKPLKPPRVYSAAQQSHSKPTQASSFAPHPGRTGRHVYGAPIQAPILKMRPKKPTTPAAPKVS